MICTDFGGERFFEFVLVFHGFLFLFEPSKLNPIKNKINFSLDRRRKIYFYLDQT